MLSLRDQTLVTVLAATDAVFIPDRDPTTRPRHQVICERRWSFPKRGIPWASEKVVPGADDSLRKRIQRALEDLIGEGLVEAFQPKLTKTLGVRLTEQGDARARALAGLPQLADSIPLLQDVWQRTQGDDGAAFLGRVWIQETLLAGVRWGDHERRKAFVDVEEKLLPAMVRGYVESNCSVEGHCWYAIWPDGVKFLSQPPAPPAKLPSRNKEARSEYYWLVRHEMLALATAKPVNDREIGEIAMPVCPILRRHEAGV